MKVRRVTLEVEVPWDITADRVLDYLDYGVRNGRPLVVPHQAQVVKDERSPNVRIGKARKFGFVVRGIQNLGSRFA